MFSKSLIQFSIDGWSCVPSLLFTWGQTMMGFPGALPQRRVAVWLVFCDCGFHSACPVMEKERGLWNLPDGRDRLKGKLGLVLMGGAQ